MKNLLRHSFTFVAWLPLAFLVACGSSQTDAVNHQLSTGVAATTKSVDFGKPASAETVKATSEKLRSYFNGQNANNPKAFMGVQTTATKTSDGSATPMIAASNVASSVFRFYNTNTGTHFFTMSASERDYIQNTFTFFTFEGKSFLAYPEADPSLSPVYRFYNKVTGTHFFTINAAEKDHVIATWPDIFNFEGVSWHASTSEGTGWVPVYRFFNTKTGTHFYTTNAAEKDHVLATWNWFTFEGIAYYVKPVAETVACTADPVGTTGYSLVFKGCDVNNVATYYDKTECVRDNVSGLIWEGKTTSGLRSMNNNYHNFDDVTKNQIRVIPTVVPGQPIPAITFIPPTQAQIDSPSNSIGYKNAVNALNLCGAATWRMPTNIELLGIVKASETPKIDNVWFPNTFNGNYWTSTSVFGRDESAQYVSFQIGGLFPTGSLRQIDIFPNNHVRLVR